MIGELIKIANHLDVRSLNKEADYLDAVIRKISSLNREIGEEHVFDFDEPPNRIGTYVMDFMMPKDGSRSHNFIPLPEYAEKYPLSTSLPKWTYAQDDSQSKRVSDYADEEHKKFMEEYEKDLTDFNIGQEKRRKEIESEQRKKKQEYEAMSEEEKGAHQGRQLRSLLKWF